jgi:hypothetical protein
MHKALRLSTLALAGATATGLIAFTAPAIADDGDGAAYKREDDSGQVVATVDRDDDDDDTNTGTNSATNSHAGAGTGDSRSRADGTNSRVTGVSRDRDHSRDDRTKDWSKDGPGTRTRDHSANQTNDRSRHDTRG